MDNIIGRKLDGRYEIQEIIGIGGMAVVYKAYDSIDDRIVAVKVLKEEYLKNEEFRRRFKNESKAVAVLSHPNIVKVFDVSFGDRIQYIVMEYIDGITLKEYIYQQKVLTWKEAVHFTVQILRALQHAHERGIVHRDIKPQNIMMLEDGTIKVTDFGIARFAHSETHTITDKAIGSVHYISPEQARGGLTDEKSDIYSVGVMLYEMLTGDLPFEAENAVSVAIMQMQEEPKLLHELNSEVPVGLEDITLHAMQKDPENRYKSALEMLDEIERFKHNPSIHFQYKYFVDESPTKYVDAIKQVKGDGLAENDNLDKKAKKTKKGNLLPILAGITAALVLVVVGMIIVDLAVNDFFGGGATVTVPNLVGQQYKDVEANTTIVSNFQILESNTQFSSSPAGQIITQSVTAETKVKKNTPISVTVSNGPQQLTVPDVYTEDKTQAEATLSNAGFTNIKETQSYDNNTPIGCIINTTPARGANAAATATITVNISMGPTPGQLKAVPNLTNPALTSDMATRAIQDAGLVAATPVQEYSSTVPSGYVTRQDPASNTQVPAQTTVNFWISEGPQPVTTVPVPNLMGIDISDATNDLANLGLAVGTVTSPSGGSTTGNVNVIWQSVAAGTSVPAGTKINLQVSNGSSSSGSNNTGGNSGNSGSSSGSSTSS